MPKKFFPLIFIFFFFLLFSAKLSFAQTITLSPSTLTARDENGIDVNISGLIPGENYNIKVQRRGDSTIVIYPAKIIQSDTFSFKLCGDLLVSKNSTDCNDNNNRKTFREGDYTLSLSVYKFPVYNLLTSAPFKVEPATSDITIDFLNTGWTTSDNVIVQLGKVSDGNYLITVNDDDPKSGGGCFGVNGGSVIRNIGKYFEGSYTLRIYDNGGGFPNPLCSKGSQVGEATPFTIKSDGTGGPGKAIPPQTKLKIRALGGETKKSAGIPCPGGIETAIGCIPTDPTAFVRGFLGFSVAIAGGIALLIMVFGAFKMITSAGNPDSLKEGQEMFTNAIIGLLFIIFSTLLLKIIGVDILGLGKFLGV